MQRIVLEVHDPLAALDFQICLVDGVAFGDLPRPRFFEGRVRLDSVVGRIGHVRADDSQRLVLVVRGESAMEGEEFGEDGFEGGVGFHNN